MRDGLEAHERCFLCDQQQETIDHIVASCPFTQDLWHHILQALRRHLPQPAASIRVWWWRLRLLWDGHQRSGMDSLFALVSWEIWKEPNARSFHGATSTMTDLLQTVKAEADQWIKTGAHCLEALLART